ncbi:MAG TPA: hypothetical protein PKY30_04545 [Myxococcota bacterium]|nr:hypothetical protein [Myxococcota bacterium]
MSPSAEADALSIWRRGHHVFFVLTQGMVMSFALSAEALRSGHWEAARGHLELAIRLMDASGTAMELAACFSAEDYEATVRPSMHPPATRAELSGMMSSDHVALMAELAGLRTQLALAQDRLYDRHIHVCERFVDRAPSLKSGGATPAVVVLERLRDRRLGPARLHHPSPAGGQSE